ncbi:hypothetical protein PanWU01x14_031900 [Parasponia andersonii]|uniref:Uncharacterized protein n=1 Tax=Parasponia andersonii TaxID=3476 RepID=A0A2P5DUA3_PARAD|nr:hypothetical protein PanWU01x14_031900 [Parasponia andersonii]
MASLKVDLLLALIHPGQWRIVVLLVIIQLKQKILVPMIHLKQPAEEEKKVAERLDKVEMMQKEVDADEEDPKTKHLTNIIDECLKNTKKVGILLGKMDNNINRQKRQSRDGQN